MDKTTDFINWVKDTQAEMAEHPLFRESTPDHEPDKRRTRTDLRLVDDTPTNGGSASE